jgi:VanZ family protein
MPQLRMRRWWLAAGWLLAAAIVWLSLVPSPPSLDVEEGDKLGHLVGYGLLMFWFGELHALRRARIAYAVAWIAMGVALEFIQGQTGYRSYDPLDMLANAIGVLIGWAIAIATRQQVFVRLERLMLR